MRRREHDGVDQETGADAGLHPGTDSTPGRAPSYCEITAYQGVTVRAAYQHTRALECEGALSSAWRHRGIRLSPEHVPPAGLPIIGRAAAGTPIFVGENLEGYLEFHRLIGERSNLFVLRLEGDSVVAVADARVAP